MTSHGAGADRNGTTATTPRPAGDAPDAPPTRPSIWRVPLMMIVVAFAAFWVWALFFASKEAVNKIGDREWARRAEGICAAADAERVELIDLREIARDGPASAAELAERADIVDRATDIVENMLGEVEAVIPDDDKGAAIVPLWIADYRTYIGNRRTFTTRLRQGRNDPFTETAVEGIPISERLEQFAGDNEMPSCAPPQDLAT